MTTFNDFVEHLRSNSELTELAALIPDNFSPQDFTKLLSTEKPVPDDAADLKKKKTKKTRNTNDDTETSKESEEEADSTKVCTN